MKCEGVVGTPKIFEIPLIDQILFHVVLYILQAVYIAIDTDKLVKEINMLLSVIKATEPNIKNYAMSFNIVKVPLSNLRPEGVNIFFQFSNTR